MKQYGEQVSWEAGQQATRDVQAMNMGEVMGLSRDGRTGDLKLQDPTGLSAFLPQEYPQTMVAQAYRKVFEQDLSKKLLIFGFDQFAQSATRWRQNPAGYAQETQAVTDGIEEQLQASAPHLVQDVQYQLQQVRTAKLSAMQTKHMDAIGKGILESLTSDDAKLVIPDITRGAFKRSLKVQQDLSLGPDAPKTTVMSATWDPTVLANIRRFWHTRVSDLVQLLPRGSSVNVQGQIFRPTPPTPDRPHYGTSTPAIVGKKIREFEQELYFNVLKDQYAAYSEALDPTTPQAYYDTDFLSRFEDGTLQTMRLHLGAAALETATVLRDAADREQGMPGSLEIAITEPDLVPVHMVFTDTERAKMAAKLVAWRNRKAGELEQWHKQRELRGEIQLEMDQLGYITSLAKAQGDATLITKLREDFISTHRAHTESINFATKMADSALEWGREPVKSDPETLNDLWINLSRYQLTREALNGALNAKLVSVTDYSKLMTERRKYLQGAEHFSKGQGYLLALRAVRGTVPGELSFTQAASPQVRRENRRLRITGEIMLFKTMTELSRMTAPGGLPMEWDHRALEIAEHIREAMDSAEGGEARWKLLNPDRRIYNEYVKQMYGSAAKVNDAVRAADSELRRLRTAMTDWDEGTAQTFLDLERTGQLPIVDDKGTVRALTVERLVKGMTDTATITDSWGDDVPVTPADSARREGPRLIPKTGKHTEAYQIIRSPGLRSLYKSEQRR